MEVKSRHHLRGDEIDEIVDNIEAALGVSITGETFEDVEFADTDRQVILIDGKPLVAYFDDQPFLTVIGANEFQPTSRVVTVDAGAISFVSNGADVMRPGITNADEAIVKDDLVVVAEETHGKVLAVGRALTDGNDMVGESGKVVESVHHVGDDLFEFSI